MLQNLASAIVDLKWVSANKLPTRRTEAVMPIRAEMRWFYPIDWPQLSQHVRFERASGIW
jgi:hypothetical protein